MGLNGTAKPARAQGATEYLVLLAVVLVIALVAIALLGFFPGMSSDAKETESKTYWLSATPIAVVEIGAKVAPALPTATVPYIRLRNTGTYPIRITKLLAASASINQSYNGTFADISGYAYLAPGEETFLGSTSYFALPRNREIAVFVIGSSACTNNARLCGATSICNPPGEPSKGTLVLKDFGFEYIAYIEGVQITKRQISKDLVVKCI